MAPYSSILAWKIPWTEEPGGLQSMGSLRVGHNWVTSLSLFTFIHWRRKWQPTPVLLPGESQGWGSLLGCRLWGRTESDTTEAAVAAPPPITNEKAYLHLKCSVFPNVFWKFVFFFLFCFSQCIFHILKIFSVVTSPLWLINTCKKKSPLLTNKMFIPATLFFGIYLKLVVKREK